MNRYGQSITWGPLSAPALFTGATQSYSYRDAVTKQLIDDASGENIAMALHSRKAEINFEAKVTDGSTDFLDLSGDNGASIAVSGISAGVVLVTRAVESWRLGQPKTASIQATHYPDITQASPVAAGTGTAFTPDQSAIGFVHPGGKIIYGAFGLGHAAGILQNLTITQMLQLTDDDTDPDGKIKGATSHGYERSISLDVLVISTAVIPAVKSVLVLTGATDLMAADYLITSAEVKFADKRGKMYSLEAAWIPPLTA